MQITLPIMSRSKNRLPINWQAYQICARVHLPAFEYLTPMSVIQTKATVLDALEVGISDKQTDICPGTNKKRGIQKLRNKHSTDEIREECWALLSMKSITVRNLAKVIGKMAAPVNAVLPALLIYQHLQRLKKVGLKQNHQSYQTVVKLNAECLEDLKWWIECIDVRNSKNCMKASPDMALRILTDASKTSWGTHCEGIKIRASELRRHYVSMY